jgi:hypothetical protein
LTPQRLPAGWINTKMLDETGDIEKSQGWTAIVLDTNGNGKRDEYTEPGQPADPNKDRRIGPTFYAVMPSPADGSIWGTLRGSPGAIVRVDPGRNPHKALSEIHNVPCRASACATATSTSRAACGSLAGGGGALPAAA